MATVGNIIEKNEEMIIEARIEVIFKMEGEACEWGEELLRCWYCFAF